MIRIKSIWMKNHLKYKIIWNKQHYRPDYYCWNVFNVKKDELSKSIQLVLIMFVMGENLMWDYNKVILKEHSPPLPVYFKFIHLLLNLMQLNDTCEFQQ